MPAHHTQPPPPDDAWASWEQAALAWGEPAADSDQPAAVWGQPAAEWGTNAWDVQARDSWSVAAEVITPWNEKSVFVDRWAANAVGALVPFWQRGVAAAARGHPPGKLRDFLDELESAGVQIWTDMPDVRESWGVVPEIHAPVEGLSELETEECTSPSSERSWVSQLRSRPRTPSVTGREREKGSAQKRANLERKGIYWPDVDDPNAPKVGNVIPPSPPRAVTESRYTTKESRAWVEDIIAQARPDPKLAKKLRAFWEVSLSA